MDYQERVSRFLSHPAIEDQNNSILSRSPSTLHGGGDNPESSSPTGSSLSTLGSGGRGSPAEAIPMLPDPTTITSPKQKNNSTMSLQGNLHQNEKQQVTNVVNSLKKRRSAELKPKAPAPQPAPKPKEKGGPTQQNKKRQAEVSPVEVHSNGIISTKETTETKASEVSGTDHEKQTKIQKLMKTENNKQVKENLQQESSDSTIIDNKLPETVEKATVDEANTQNKTSKVSKLESTENPVSKALQPETKDTLTKVVDPTREKLETKDPITTVADLTRENVNSDKTQNTANEPTVSQSENTQKTANEPAISQSENKPTQDNKQEPEVVSTVNQLDLITSIQPPSEFQDTSTA